MIERTHTHTHTNGARRPTRESYFTSTLRARAIYTHQIYKCKTRLHTQRERYLTELSKSECFLVCTWGDSFSRSAQLKDICMEAVINSLTSLSLCSKIEKTCAASNPWRAGGNGILLASNYNLVQPRFRRQDYVCCAKHYILIKNNKRGEGGRGEATNS